MGNTMIGPAEGSRQQQRWLTGGLVGFAVGIGFCAGIGVFQGARNWNHRDPDAPRTAAPHAVVLAPARAVNAPAEPAEGYPTTIRANSEKKPLKPVSYADSTVGHHMGAVAETASRPTSAGSAHSSASTPAHGRAINVDLDLFVLPQPPVSAPAPSILPEKPWFALADLKVEEPESSQDTSGFCAVNRSLNTALTWAKSPAEAALQAKRDGKLVFLIHVSGNFENPGFT
jgi:hypothetical protein